MFTCKCVGSLGEDWFVVILVQDCKFQISIILSQYHHKTPQYNKNSNYNSIPYFSIMKNDDFKHQLKGWVGKELWSMFLPLQNYYLKQLHFTLSESLPVIFCPLCFAITSWWLWREKSCWRRGWLVIVSSNANHDKSDPESNSPVSLLFCTFGVISIQRGIITSSKDHFLFAVLPEAIDKTFSSFAFLLDHSYVFMCRATTKQIKSGRFLSLGR